MEKSGKKYLVFDPEEVLKLGSEERAETGYLIIENISPNIVAFKIRADNEVYVSATPSKGILGPSEHVEVRISFTNITFQKEPIRLQVLAVPVDDKYQDDADITKLIKRAYRKDIQDQRFTVYHGLGYDPPKHPAQPSKKVLSEVHSKKVTPVASEQEQQQMPVAASSDNTSMTWNPANLRYLKRFFPAMVAYNSKTGTDQQSGSESESGSATPHYQLHMSNTDAELSETRFPMGRRLLRKFSSIGVIMKELAEQSMQLRKSQRWVFVIFAMALVFLTIVAFFLVLLPLWYEHRRHHHAAMTLPGYIDVSDIAETFIEDRKGMTLDEYLHWRMN